MTQCSDAHGVRFAPGNPRIRSVAFSPGFPPFRVSKLEWSPWNLYFQLPFLGEMFQKITLKGLKLDFRCWRNFEEIFGSRHTLLQCRTLQSWDISHSDKVGSMVNNTYIYIYNKYHKIIGLIRSLGLGKDAIQEKDEKSVSSNLNCSLGENNHQIFVTRCH